MTTHKPQLTAHQQWQVIQARKAAESTAEQIADDHEHEGPTSAFALGVAQQNIKYLLAIIDGLTGGEA